MNMMSPVHDPAAKERIIHIRNLIQEARGLAAEQVTALEGAMAEVGLLASQVVEGGDIYPPGLREIARRLAEDAPWACQTLGVIRKRTLEPHATPEIHLREPEARAVPEAEEAGAHPFGADGDLDF